MAAQSSSKHLTLCGMLASKVICDPCPFCRLHYVLRGVKRSQGGENPTGRERLPITPHLLRRIKAVWDGQATNPDLVMMLWADCCLPFFGFMRTGELIVPSDTGFDASVHLAWGDVVVDDPSSSAVVSVKLKPSKTDPFRQGVTLYIGKTSSDICPASAMLAYLLVRGSIAGHLFMYHGGRHLTRQRFVTAVSQAFESAGVQEASYAGHSFPIGAATTAASRGIEDSTIKIRRQQLATYSAMLC